MVAAPSAGILLYRRRDGLEVLLGHMGGPFWARKDARAWSIPKGEMTAGEEPLAAARREFAEELGVEAPAGEFTELGTFRYASGKLVTVFTAEADAFEVADPVFGTFEMEWPPRSGRMQSFPEIDDVRWVDVVDAREKLVVGQLPAIDALVTALS
jgi:predicted NUDIX family NTP pyrophosphohydrolase